MDANKDFYILEHVSHPGIYWVDNQFGATHEVLLAERFSSPEEALKYWEDTSQWKVCRVHLDIQYV